MNKAIAAWAFAIVTIANYAPAFAGKVPFPRDLVLRHAAWADMARGRSLQQFPEIGDLITSFYPFHTIAARAWREGTLPLWNPYILSGGPFVGNFQSALFYPFNALYYILPTAAAWTVLLILRMFLAAWFMGLLVRAIGGSATGAIVSGIVFATCGFMTAWQGQAMGDAAIWLPMICYAVNRLHLNPNAKTLAPAAIAFSMPVLAGHPETAFHLTVTGSLMALMYWLFPAGQDGHAFNWRFAAYFAIAGVLAVGLASVQVIPGVEWAGQPGWSYDFVTPALSWHDGQGFFSRDVQQNLNSAGIPVPEAAAYIGMFTLLAAPLALFHASRGHVVFFAAITVIATAIAFSVDPAHWVVAHLPFIKVMKHGRLILVASFGLAALAGLGVSALEQNADAVLRKRRWVVLALAAVASVAIVGIYKLHLATLAAVSVFRGPAASLVCLSAALALLGWGVAGGLKRRAFWFLVVGLSAVEMVSFSYGYTGFSRASEVFPTAPVFEFLRGRNEPGVFRFAKAGYPISANAGVMYGLEAADGYEICLLPTRTFCRDLTHDRDDAVFFLSDRVVDSRDRRVDMLNVKYFLVASPSPEEQDFARRPDRFVPVFKEGSVALFENKTVLPRLLAVPQSGIEVIEDPARQRERMKDPAFDPERMVVFGSRPDGIATGSPEGSHEIHLLARDANSSRFKVRTTAASVLVLSQIYFQGWKAAIDGVETSVYPVNYAFTGILAPAGEHEVHFFFDPTSFKVGAALSLASLCITGALLISARSPRARH